MIILQLLLQILRLFLQILQPILVPVCFILAWGLAIATFWTIFSSIRDTVAQSKTMHQIPCSGCQFFTNDYRLKCTIQPTLASTEQAIDCCDFRARSPFS
ncbi:MAG: hypothetical protein SAJ12_06120 [Jaaginema sp. PMC 1079.18]|nr:hypothetical protein [Jaaginema sp. PMC 1080.18]MEC4850568.1 hypothetical protein [Jaaginema sp. PMC 1079.18]MEC4866695.1 hypothetical protein [Jaaginema sp. PMC 1078.18]